MIQDFPALNVSGYHPVVADALAQDAVIGNHPVFCEYDYNDTSLIYQLPGLYLSGEGATFDTVRIGSRIRCSDPDPTLKPEYDPALSSDTSATITVDPGLRKAASESNYHYQSVDPVTGQPSGPTAVSATVRLLDPLPTLGQTTPFYIQFSPVQHYAVKTVDHQGNTIGLGYVPYDVFGRPYGYGYHYEFVQGERPATGLVSGGFGAIEFFREVNNVRTVIGSYRLIGSALASSTDGPILSSAPQTYMFDCDAGAQPT
jgi:hypothetical protein